MSTISTIPNLLLARLPRKEYAKLVPALSPVTLTFGDVLYEPGSPIGEVYFPDACLVSLLTIVEGHLALGVGMVGRDGMVGTALALGIKTSPVRALVQGGGAALQMTKAAFLRAMAQSPVLQRVVNGYIHLLMGQISQTAACNRFHLVDARLARWLLMTRDRVGLGEFELTQEFLSHMLGVRREGVTEAASVFARRRLIEYSRGHIKILDHPGLEAAACSCYAAGADAIAPWRPEPPATRTLKQPQPAP